MRQNPTLGELIPSFKAKGKAVVEATKIDYWTTFPITGHILVGSRGSAGILAETLSRFVDIFAQPKKNGMNVTEIPSKHRLVKHGGRRNVQIIKDASAPVKRTQQVRSAAGTT